MTPEARRIAAGHAMGLFTAFAWGSAYPVAKPLVGSIDPVGFSVLRYAVAMSILMALLAATRGGLKLPRRLLPRMLLLGVVGFTMFQGLWGIALSLSTAAKGAVLLATSPVFGALIASVGGERQGLAVWAGIAVAFAGVVLVIAGGPGGLDLGDGSLGGDALFLLCAFLWAVYSALSRPAVAEIGALATAAWSGAFGILLLAPFGLPGLLAQDWGGVEPMLGLNFLWLSAVAGAGGMLTWYGGLARLGLTRAMMYLYVSPVFAVLLAALLLGEWFRPMQALGALSVLAGIWLAERGRATAARRT